MNAFWDHVSQAGLVTEDVWVVLRSRNASPAAFEIYTDDSDSNEFIAER